MHYGANSNEKENAASKYKDPIAYENYIRKKFDCMKAEDYQVIITPRLYYRAVRDKKIEQWLEYNLNQLPFCMKNLWDIVAITGGRIVECTYRMNNYNSISTDVSAVDEMSYNGIYRNPMKLSTIRTSTVSQIEDFVRYNSIFWASEIRDVGFQAQA